MTTQFITKLAPSAVLISGTMSIVCFILCGLGNNQVLGYAAVTFGLVFVGSLAAVNCAPKPEGNFRREDLYVLSQIEDGNGEQMISPVFSDTVNDLYKSGYIIRQTRFESSTSLHPTIRLSREGKEFLALLKSHYE